MKNLQACLTPVVFICALLLFVKPVKAQTMDMQGMPMPAASGVKNVFLSMMDTMMVAMDKAGTQNGADQDFLAQMIPHHEGAIAMAQYEINHGNNFEMIQLAKSILQEQNSEVAQMRLWLNDLSSRPATIPAGYNQAMDKAMDIMMKNMPYSDSVTNTDRAFALVMIPHHQAAIDMAKVVLRYPENPQVAAYAKLLISNEQVEIEQMKTFTN